MLERPHLWWHCWPFSYYYFWEVLSSSTLRPVHKPETSRWESPGARAGAPSNLRSWGGSRGNRDSSVLLEQIELGSCFRSRRARPAGELRGCFGKTTWSPGGLFGISLNRRTSLGKPAHSNLELSPFLGGLHEKAGTSSTIRPGGAPYSALGCATGSREVARRPFNTPQRTGWWKGPWQSAQSGWASSCQNWWWLCWFRWQWMAREKANIGEKGIVCLFSLVGRRELGGCQGACLAVRWIFSGIQTVPLDLCWWHRNLWGNCCTIRFLENDSALNENFS